jgi:hypothetical protein
MNKLSRVALHSIVVSVGLGVGACVGVIATNVSEANDRVDSSAHPGAGDGGAANAESFSFGEGAQ